MRLQDIGIQDYKRKPDDFNNICLVKINGRWNEYRMITDIYGWLKVVISIESGTYYVSLLDMAILLGRV